MPTTPLQHTLLQLLPHLTTATLPPTLTSLATSFLAQSRTRASTLRPEEEIARLYACCHIACERLGKKLSLELIAQPNPPMGKKGYERLKLGLGAVLRMEGGTPGRGRAGELTPSKEVATPTKTTRMPTRTPPSRRSVRPATLATKEDEVMEDAPVPMPMAMEEDEGLDEDDEEAYESPLPVKRPAKTPLRRKEKRARRDYGSDEDEEVGAAGLLPGLGTMFQPAVDWLCEDWQTDYAQWEKGMRRDMAVMEKQGVAG